MNVLLICMYDSNGPRAVIDHIESIQKLSLHNVDIFNVQDFSMKFRKYFKKKISSYDCIILHNTVSYNPQNLMNINEYFNPSLKDFKNIKVVMKQDEMKQVNSTINLLKDWNVSLLATCLDKENSRKVYGSLLGKLQLIHTLTGYVTTEMRSRKLVPLENRPLDVVYRGMQTPFEWGSLGYEKYYIGEEFKKYAHKKKLKFDISSENSDRIYGNAWFDFLSSSRSTLAVESGASVFDFTGDIEARCKEFKRLHPQALFQDAFEEILKPHDCKIYYNQISPRHLEAVSLGTVQIMFEGKYNDILLPDVHYIPLKKDFSNIDLVIDKLRDNSLCNQIILNSRKDILLREDLTFNFFISNLDASLAKLNS